MLRMLKLIGGSFLFFSLALQGQDLCNYTDMKPVLSLAQMTQAEFTDVLCEITGLKSSPAWPKDVSKMTPKEYNQMEVKLLVDNGFPPILQEVEPNALVNRRFFASLMFQIAKEADDQVKKDCANMTSETQQLECLTQHDYVYAKSLSIYRNEILTVLCTKKNVLKKVPPKEVSKPSEIYPEEFKEGILMSPGTHSSREEHPI